MNLSRLDVFLILKDSGIFVPMGFFKEKEKIDFYIGKNIVIKYNDINNGEIEITGRIPIELMEEFYCLKISETNDKHAWFTEEFNILNIDIPDEILFDFDFSENYICYCRVNSRKELLKFVNKLKNFFNGTSHNFNLTDEEIEVMEKNLKLKKLEIIKDKVFNNELFDKSCNNIGDMLEQEETIANIIRDFERANLIIKLRDVLSKLINIMSPNYITNKEDILNLITDINVTSEKRGLRNQIKSVIINLNIDDRKKLHCKYVKSSIYSSLEFGLEFGNSIYNITCFNTTSFNITFLKNGMEWLSFDIRNLRETENERLMLIVSELEELYQLVTEFIVAPHSIDTKKQKVLKRNKKS